jgi:hypothetical protein
MAFIERWLTVPDHQSVLEEESGRVDPQLIRKQTAESITGLQELSYQTFSRWVDRFDFGSRRRALPSR